MTKETPSFIGTVKATYNNILGAEKALEHEITDGDYAKAYKGVIGHLSEKQMQTGSIKETINLLKSAINGRSLQDMMERSDSPYASLLKAKEELGDERFNELASGFIHKFENNLDGAIKRLNTPELKLKSANEVVSAGVTSELVLSN